MGGDIKVYSEIGKGSTFDIYLPLMEKSAGIESIPDAEENQGGNERILLVDDEEAIVKLEKQMLEKMGLDGLLMKPILKSELAKRVRKVLDKARD